VPFLPSLFSHDPPAVAAAAAAAFFSLQRTELSAHGASLLILSAPSFLAEGNGEERETGLRGVVEKGT